MKNLYSNWHLNLMAVCCLAFIQNVSAESVTLSKEQRQAIQLTSTNIQTTQHLPSQWFLGKVDVLNQSTQTINAGVSGRVIEVLQHSGHVEQNQALIVLESPEVTQQQSLLLSSMAQLDAATKNLKRLTTLSRTGGASSKALQAAQAEVTSLKIAQSAAEQTLIELDFEPNALKKLKRSEAVQPSQITLRTPIDSEIHDVLVMPGQQVNAYEPLMKLLNHEQMMVKVPVPASSAMQLNIGDSATIKTLGQQMQAKIQFIPHHLDPLTQTQEVYLSLENKAPYLNLNQQVSVKFAQPTTSRTYKAPLSSLTQTEGQNVVFVQQESGEITQHAIKVISIVDQTLYFQPIRPMLIEKVITKGTSAIKLALAAQSEQE